MKKTIIIFLFFVLLLSGSLLLQTDKACSSECAQEGEEYSIVFDTYPDHCCSGLTEWERGMDTSRVVDGECVDSDSVSGYPLGLCINCGNGICEEIESACNCPEDCGSLTCLTEGKTQCSYGMDLQCCEGLTAIPSINPDGEGQCGEIRPCGSTCTNCGNGICGVLENICNCPDDCIEVDEGDLIKSNDLSTVYYLGDDNGTLKRYVFPNQKTFDTWYDDFSTVKTVSRKKLESYPLSGVNITYRPGVKMLKITTDPKVYAVDRDGTLRWIKSQAIADGIYGLNWEAEIHDLPDSFLTSYNFGEDITSDEEYRYKKAQKLTPDIATDLGHYTDEEWLQACAQAEEESFAGREYGDIIMLGLKSDVTMDEGRSAIESHGLDDIYELTSMPMIHVTVPLAEVFEWSCRLEKEAEFYYVEVSGVVYAH